ncbi:hypothetical protein GCM10023155_17040 [Bremerella cremea]
MRYALQIYSVNFGSRRVWLDASKVVRVGRTTRSELTVPEDPHLSGLHFSISLEEDRIMLKDLQSRNGTFVNGAKVGAAMQLHDGDVIVAGKTQFQIVVVSDQTGSQSGDVPPQTSVPMPETASRGSFSAVVDYDRTESISPENNPFVGGSSKPTAEPTGVPSYPRLSSHSFKDLRRHAGLGSDFPGRRAAEEGSEEDTDMAASSPEPPAAASASDSMTHRPISAAELSRGLQIRYETRMAPSGMTYFCPRNEVKPPTDVADFIGQSRFLYAVVNFGRLQPQQQPSFYNEAMALGAVQLSSTQLLIPKRDVESFHSILQQTWGQDAMICMGSRLNKLEFMSLAYRLSNELASPTQLLNHLYSDGQFISTGQLDGISAVLLEIERGARWVIFKNDSEIRTWRTLGLPCPPELVG